MEISKAFPNITSEFFVKIHPINWVYVPIGLLGLLLSKLLQPSLGAQSTKVWIGLYLVFIWFWFGRKVRSIEFNGSVITLNRLGNAFPTRQSQKGFFFPEIEILSSELHVAIKNETVMFSDDNHTYVVVLGPQTAELKEWLKKQGITWHLVNA